MSFSTYGELRQQLRAEGLSWIVNPAFPDHQPIVRHSMGLDVSSVTPARNVPPVDVLALIRRNPPANALLHKHLADRGMFLNSLPFKGSALGARSAPAAHHAGPMPAAGPPSTVDWRNRWTWNFVTSIRDQAVCEHCWIYAATALVECMVRIEHCIWCDRTEGDYIEAKSVPCGRCGNADSVLDWFKSHGVSGQDCVPWVDVSDPSKLSGGYWNPPPTDCGKGSMSAPPKWNPPSNRNGKTVKIPQFTAIGKVEEQKAWIDAIGPLVISMKVYSDFSAWTGPSPYKKSATAKYDGGHVMLAVGYDDTAGCWICKNSWGTAYGEAGFFLVAYGECDIDNNAKYGLQNVDPDPWTKRRSHAGSMVETGNGVSHRDFELTAPGHGGSFTHWVRDNTAGHFAWSSRENIGDDVSGPPTLTATTYNRNLEVIYRRTRGQLHHWYFDQSLSQWIEGPIFGPPNSVGSVGFCESSYGQGNLEVVVALDNGQIQHWWRAGPWNAGPTFASDVFTAGPSLIQSTFGNLEMIATLANGKMQHWWRAGTNWIAGPSFGNGIKSTACMIQGQFGADTDQGIGNFELCVAMPDGTVQHWWRNNQHSDLAWSLGGVFGSGVRQVIALLQGSFGFNLEVVVIRTDGLLQHYWRDDGGWHADAATIGTTS